MEFCGCTQRFGEGAVSYKLANQRPKFYVESWPVQFARDQFVAACVEAFNRWSAVCDLVFTPTNDPGSAQFKIFLHQFDGQSGILADCQLPSPGLSPQDMRIDPSERWTINDNPQAGTINLLAVLCHEMGHGIGLSHMPSGPPADLMEPTYSPAVSRPTSTLEIETVKRWYGPPQTTNLPTTPALGDSLGVDMIITTLKTLPAGSRFTFKGTK